MIFITIETETKINSIEELNMIANELASKIDESNFMMKKGEYLTGLGIGIDPNDLNKFSICFRGVYIDTINKDVASYITNVIQSFLMDLESNKTFSVSNLSMQLPENEGRVISLTIDLFKPKLNDNAIFFNRLKIDNDEIPEKYLCSITNELMQKPVFIDNNDNLESLYYDEDNLKYHIFQKTEFDEENKVIIFKDPFKQTNFTLSDIKSVSQDFKLELDNYIKQVKEKYTILEKILNTYKLKDASDENLSTALRRAAGLGNLEDLKYLATKVDINKKDTNPTNYKTALHWAVINKHKDCINFLLDNNAKIDIKDALNKTVLDYAKDKEEILEIFFQRKIIDDPRNKILFKN